MIEIRIRWAESTRATHLADVRNVAEIDDVLRSLKSWGIVDLDEPDDVVGQWVAESDSYFEFVIGSGQ